ncbi:uncharacterized protein LOC143864776 isoform X1 [Tasmannia lanceolata]|uniref:uncharacterized protein LOC143864776 isoform X1 n=2 Tax=Tasmannia lanceolata TaxID=3420 RepID=UPI004063B38C
MLRYLGQRVRSSSPQNLSLLGTRFLLRADFSEKVEKMVENDTNHITWVLFCGPHWPASQNYTREYLHNYPFIQVDDVPHDDVPDAIGKYHICVVKNRRLDSEVITRANKMKLILQFGVGLEGVDVDAATRCGIKVARLPGDVTGNAASCAEMAIYLMLGLLRKQKEMEVAVKQRRLGEPLGDTLLGKTVFICGFGNIGIDLAKRLRPFGVRILATKRSWALDLTDSSQSNGSSDKSPSSSIKHGDISDLVDMKGGPENLYDFAREADIVVTCLALNSETVGIVNKKFISSMRRGSLLVNIARGGLLDYESVSYHLSTGHLGGLGIDVAWAEPFDPDDQILKFPNVLITPHVAGVTEYSYRTMAKVVGDSALQLHAGSPLTGIEFVN